jgi:tripartite ATP-independent transporter DctM subunit
VSWAGDLAVVLGLLVATLASGLWIPFALGAAGIATLLLYGHGGVLAASVASIAWNTIDNFVLTSVPLFLLMGEIVLQSGLTTRFYRGLAVWLAGVRGGLLHCNVVGAAIFSAVCGSSAATAAAMGTVAMPEMLRRRYDPRLVYGTVAAGGALGNLIPPGIATILYGAMVEQSIAKLFIASVLPGALVTAAFLAYVWLAVRRRPERAPAPAERPSWPARGWALLDVAPVVLLMVAVLGSLWFGIATPTECAAVGAVGALAAGIGYRGLDWTRFRTALTNTSRVTCMILFIMIGAQILSFALVRTDLSRQVTQWVVDLELTRWTLLGVVVLLYVGLGMMMDGLSMMLLTLPVLYPIVLNAGFDPIWFGVVLVTLIELGGITPPVGLVLFVIQGISRGSMAEIVRGTIPFMVLLLLAIAFMAAVPGVVTWLPGAVR